MEAKVPLAHVVHDEESDSAVDGPLWASPWNKLGINAVIAHLWSTLNYPHSPTRYAELIYGSRLGGHIALGRGPQHPRLFQQC